ncbi:hypothetical protein L1994_03320 [Methanomicrobium antiquum]|uniref:Uncharacterized protein n=1 Tax=Methanomicrobium antiquum TaxID=487686 RepID=A0AAF0JM46_9EURY|nr:hypothetical protein [Methanomicrobium antiquum]WFN37434.1 hypothetical protein L1994_03320 [Methanomicrobium antiquum]
MDEQFNLQNKYLYNKYLHKLTKTVFLKSEIISGQYITELEQKRNKLRMIKEGMMQELLTGRIRLV